MRMTLTEFWEYLEKQPIQTYIVGIELKYDFKKDYRRINEILSVDSNCDYVWGSDWNEGEEDVRIVWCVALDDIDSDEIIRCQNCKNGIPHNHNVRCELYYGMGGYDEYCSRAERRIDGN